MVTVIILAAACQSEPNMTIQLQHLQKNKIMPKPRISVLQAEISFLNIYILLINILYNQIIHGILHLNITGYIEGSI